MRKRESHENEHHMICDSEATSHMTGDKFCLYNTIIVSQTNVMIADGRTITSTLIGEIYLKGENSKELKIEGVLYVHGLREGHLLVRQACDTFADNVVISKGGCSIFKHEKEVLRGRRSGAH